MACRRMRAGPSGAVSTSIHWWKSRLRAANSRSRSDSGENVEPMIRRGDAGIAFIAVRRLTKARRRVSLSSGSVAIMRRKASCGTTINSPASAIRASI